MVETKTQNTFWLWNTDIDLVKRLDVQYLLLEKLTYLESDKTISDFFDLISGYAFNSEWFQEQGEVPVIKMTQIVGDGSLDLTRAEYLSKDYLDKYSKFVVRKGDVLVALTGATIGKSGYYYEDRPSLLNQRVLLLRRKDNYSNEFLLAFCLTDYFVNNVIKESGGGARTNISPFSVGSIKFLQTTKSSQQKVEQITKDALQLKEEAEKEYQKATMLLEATLKFGNENQKTFTRWSNEINFVERLDVGYWRQSIKVDGKKLSEVASVNTGRQYTAYENAKSEVEFISIKDFGNLYVGEADRFVLQNDVIDKTKITKGDVLLAVTGATIGKVGIFNRPQAVVSADVAIIRTKALNPNFLGALIQSRYGKSLIDKYTYGATNKHLDIRGFLENFVIPKIDKKIADKIGDLLYSSSKHKEESKQKLQEAKDFVENLIKKSKTEIVSSRG